MMPNGMYLMRAQREKAEFGKSGQDGTTLQVAIPLVVVENGQFKGQIIMWNGTFKPGDPMRITMDGLKMLGWDGTKPVSNLSGVGTKDVQATVENDPKYGPKVRTLREPGKQFWQGGLMNKDELAALDGVLDQASTQSTGQRRQARPTGQRPGYASGGGSSVDWDGQGAPPGGGNDDDVPF